MDAYWHPVCSACRGLVSSVAVPGDARGPIHLDSYSNMSDVFCSTQGCGRKVRIDTCAEWRPEALWSGGFIVTPARAAWDALTRAREFTY